MSSSPPTRQPAPPCSWRLPLLLSLAAHGLLALALFALPGGASRNDNRSLPVGAVALAPDTRITCAIDPPPRGRPAQTAPLAITVHELPVVSDPPASGPGTRADAQAGGDGPASDGGSGPTTDGSGGGTWVGPSLFQVGGRGRSIVYVIDRSLSMGLNGTLDAAKRELLASLEQLPETVRFQVILYNRQAEPLRLHDRTELTAATAENKRQVAELVGPLRAAGPTDHLAALKRALLLRPEVIFLVTDTADLTAQQIQSITVQNQGRTAIHAIELARPAGPEGDGPLALLARSNRGTYRRVGPN